ncbi:MAG: hypothetical protein HYX67_10710 [Candidatus Melainabacteria bacterium]|nr:hypothetical protein [Candidatus Melainabacteria bacterium]
MQEIDSRKRLRKIGGRDYIEFAVTQVDFAFNAFENARAATYRVLDDKKMPVAVGKVLKRICGFNSIKTNQIPISLEVVTNQGMLDRFLMTTEISTVQNVKAEGPPTNYKRVAKEMDVFRDPQMQEDIKDMLDANERKTR